MTDNGRAPGISSFLVRVAAALVVVWIARVFIAPPALAVTVSTVEFALEAEQGGHAEAEFTLLNDERLPLRFALEVVDWDDDPDGVTRILAPGEIDRSCGSWIVPTPTSGFLQPAQETVVRVAIDVPEAVLPGTHWTGVLVSVRPEGEASNGAVGLPMLRRFLVRLFVTVPPAAASGRVVAVEVGGVRPFGASIRFENTGNARLVGVSGTITVEDSRGEILLDLPVAPFDVLPGRTVDVRASSPWDVADPGEYWVRSVLDFGADYLVAGQTLLRIPKLDLGPIGGAVGVPADLDGDGLYEDVDGNGLLDLRDAELLRSAIDTPAVQRNARAFDFDNDGSVTLADVEWLLESVWRSP